MENKYVLMETVKFPVTGRSSVMMTISEAAKRVGLSAKTIRYYEEEGVISPAIRANNGYRQYNEHHIDQLLFIKHARDLGFSLQESRSLLSLSLNSDRENHEVRDQARQHILKLRQTIQDLQRIESRLTKALAACTDEQGACPILDVIQNNHIPEPHS
jgi:MerR family copper efflux transcriptional regulator